MYEYIYFVPVRLISDGWFVEVNGRYSLTMHSGFAFIIGVSIYQYFVNRLIL